MTALQGMRVRPEGPQLISEMVRRTLGIDCSVLMGANIAEACFCLLQDSGSCL